MPTGSLVAHCGLVDLPILGPAQGLVGPNQQEDLNKPGMAPHPIDLLRRQVPILVGNDHGGPQPGFRIQPFGNLPVIDRPGQRGSVVQVELPPGSVKTVEDAVLDIVGIQQLLPHELQIRARRQSRRRPGIMPGGIHQRPWIVSPQVAAQSERLMVPAPSLRQVLVEGLIGRDDVVDVTVDDLQLRLFATGRGLTRGYRCRHVCELRSNRTASRARRCRNSPAGSDPELFRPGLGLSPGVPILTRAPGIDIFS